MNKYVIGGDQTWRKGIERIITEIENVRRKIKTEMERMSKRLMEERRTKEEERRRKREE